MSIDFNAERWRKVAEDSDAWWDGRLGRPLIQIRVAGGRDAGRPEPALPRVPYASHYEWATPAEAIVDRWDYDLSREEWLGDAFPTVWPNFGPGVVAAFLGCDLINAESTVWFHAPEKRPLADLHFKASPENAWFRRVADLCRAATERWQGGVQVGMTDLGGALDILASFRPGEGLLTDLYDDPDQVRRAVDEIHEAWWFYYDALHGILREGGNPGFSAWTPLFSTKPYYMLQSDFAYMIGPDMFRQFVLPELERCTRRLSNAFYHLDGKGQLPHLDALLALPELRGVQWVPGDGAPGVEEWPEVQQTIRKAGKRSQQFFSMESFDRLVERTGSAAGLAAMIWIRPTDRARAMDFLKKYGAA
jgi:hypothetical protein